MEEYSQINSSYGGNENMRTITDVTLSSQAIPASELDSGAAKKSSATSLGGVLYPPTNTNITGVVTGKPIVSGGPNDPRKQQDVALLDQAEALAQDAYQKVSPFHNGTLAEKLVAEKELHQAEQIRAQVEPDLTTDQQRSLDIINSEEEKAFTDATTPGNGFFGDLERGFSVTNMIDAANRSKALDNSILQVTVNPPLFPIWFPFTKVS
jgi:hypothetical protein